MSGIAEPARIVAEPGADDDRQLVAAVRGGDDRAFEALYARYHRRINAYVLGMVKDHGRAEDVTQEVFVSAVRRMRETERPIAFKPWIYEIAKNACIDQFRRSRRTEEVSLEADEGLAPGDYGRLVGSDPMPDDAVVAKQELDNLCGAFGGLSDTHREILLLRELEGLSYREIGERMGMSRPAVESTLFRARRRLTEEYDELRSGARCIRIQGLIATATSTRLGTREQRRLSRHVAYCEPCRREALAAGLDSAILTHVPLRKRAAAKISGLLPFPTFGRRFGAGGGTDGAGGGWMANAPILSEQLSGGWGKLATAAAVLVAGVGAAGVGTKVVGGSDRTDSPKRAVAPGAAAASTPSTAGTRRVQAKSVARTERGTQRSRVERRTARNRSGSGSGSANTGSPAVGGSGSGGSTGSSGGSGGGSSSPAAKLPAAGDQPVKKAVDDVGTAVQPVVDGVGETVEGVDNTVGQTVDGVGNTVGQTVDGVGNTVGQTVEGVGGTVDQTVGGVGDTVDQTVGGVGGIVDGATGIQLPGLP